MSDAATPIDAAALAPYRKAPRWLAHRIEWLETTDSTNRVAAELARDGAAHGTVVIAEEQTAGRGRLGRSFHSPSHQNLYTSIVLRPEGSIAALGTTVLAAAIAVAEAVEAELPEAERPRVEIKWPNDVLIGGLKTSGILMELSAEGARVAHAILGIGVNLNVDPESFPDEFRRRATSLRAAAGRPIDRAPFAARLYGTLEDVLDLQARDGFDALRPRFEARFRMRGAQIRVAEPGGAARDGEALGIAADGALRLRRPDGTEERVLAGDVTIVKGEAR